MGSGRERRKPGGEARQRRVDQAGTDLPGAGDPAGDAGVDLR